ncbi:AraC family transcriptional regulator [Novosphingobium sp. 9]|uniref:AraC family transcriptional regulator n=1 Tax=Novosphingobium sp. 9 TaxID=2025349 RepID=UPI0021B530EE|nr:AraC family transcriptional regulator [Novosphingobium sp. 9]
MPHSRFDATALPPAARLSGWCGALSDFAITTDCALASAEAREASVAQFRSPRGISFSALEGGAQTFAPMAERNDAVFWLTMVTRGTATLKVDGRPVSVAPGDVLFARRGAPGELEMHGDFRIAMANIPADLLARASLVSLPVNLIHLKDAPGPVRVLGAMLAAVTESIERLDEASALAMETALVQLLLGSLFDDPARNPLGGLASVRAGALRRICRSIEENLHDGELSLSSVAKMHRVSVRYVQMLFAESGHTFRGHLRTRRLERCREALGDPHQKNASLTEICLNWGFGDSASFSRAFREEYGCTPSSYRSEALGAARNSVDRLRNVRLVEH